MSKQPTNLTECIQQLQQIFDDESNGQQELKLIDMTETSDCMIDYHSTLGRYIRNKWELWKSNELTDYFKSIGITHPDDMSHFIFVAFWRHRHGIFNEEQMINEQLIKNIIE